MHKNKIKNVLRKLLPSRIKVILKKTISIKSDMVLYFATIVGYVPSHNLRFFFYRYIFGVNVPHDSIIYWRCRFFNPPGVHIGHHSIIGDNAFLDGRCEIHIGNNVNIAGEVRVYTMEHDVNSPTFAGTGSAVRIGDYVYVGTRVTILPGVSIGHGAVIASGSVVTKNIEPWVVVGGIPAKFIKNRPVVRYTLDTRRKVLFQ